MNHALQTGKSLDEFQDLTRAGVNIVDPLQYSLHDPPDCPPIRGSNGIFGSTSAIRWRSFTRKAAYISRSSIECAAADYLNLPYRSARIELILVDVAMELFEFSDEMLVAYPVGSDSPRVLD
jgi:hypothetical protein